MIVLILFGLVCFIVPGFVWAFILLASLQRSQTAIGTIVGQDAISGIEGGDDLTAPIVEFQLPDGRKITFTERIHSNETIFDILYKAFSQLVLKQDVDKVKVLYDPANPQNARVNSFGNIYFMPIILFLIGFSIVLYAIPVVRDFFKPVFNFIERLTNSS